MLYLAATLGRDGGESDSALAARSRARVHPEGCADPADLRAVGVAPARLRRDAEPRREANSTHRRKSSCCAAKPEAIRHGMRCSRSTRAPQRVARARCGRGENGALHLGNDRAPQGGLHSHNSIHALICQLREHWLIERGDKFLVPSPIAHIGGSIYAFESPLLLGTTAVLMDRWDADEAVRLMDAEGCTHMAGATPFLEQLLAAARRAATRLPRLKVFVCGGASVPPSLIRSAAAYFERAVVTRVYGSTEVPVTTVGVTQAQRRRACRGHRWPRGSRRDQVDRSQRGPRGRGRDPCARPADAGRLSASRG